MNKPPAEWNANASVRSRGHCAAILYCRIWDTRREFNILKQFKKKW